MSGCNILKTDGVSSLLLVNAVDHLILTNCVPVTGTSGTLAATEAPDSAAFTGTVSAPAITGTLAATEAKDTAFLTGVGAIVATGTLEVTESSDRAVILGRFKESPFARVPVKPSRQAYGWYSPFIGPLKKR